jgi:hypothetical protein
MRIGGFPTPAVSCAKSMNQSNRMSKPFWRRISLIEWGVAGLITLASVYLHWICSRSAGALWRDETGIVNIAQLHSWQEVWNALPHDHCPVIFPLLVRAWSEAGLGATDYGLRILGLGIGLGLLTAIWISLRLMGRGLPLLTVALVSMNSTVIIFGDSLRAYGLATVFILLTLGLVWHFLERPNWQRGLLAAITAMASVQTLYQNAFLVLAICVAGIALSVQRRQYRTALAMMGIGLVSALSLLPYVHAMIEAQSWWALSKPREGVGAFIAQLIQISGGAEHTWFLFVWFISVIMAATLGAGHFLVINQETAVQRNDVCFFAGVALVAGFAGYGSFFMLSGLTVQPWYCIPLFGFIAVCCDVILPRIHPVTRLGVLLVAILSPLLAYPVVHTQVQQPRTNGYLVAEKLSRHIIPGDLIIVYPWYYGITFARYYHGGLPWETLPPLGDYRFHRYDLLKTKDQCHPVGLGRNRSQAAFWSSCLDRRRSAISKTNRHSARGSAASAERDNGLVRCALYPGLGRATGLSPEPPRYQSHINRQSFNAGHKADGAHWADLLVWLD